MDIIILVFIDLFLAQMILELWSTFQSENKTSISEVILAGYGNKETDTKAYLAAGLQPSTVFIVNPEGWLQWHRRSDLPIHCFLTGELKNVGTGHISSYQKQIELIQNLYP